MDEVRTNIGERLIAALTQLRDDLRAGRKLKTYTVPRIADQLRQSEADIDAGRVTSHERVKAELGQ